VLRDIRDALPARFYAHLTPGVEDEFADHFAVRSGGEHYKMALFDPKAARAIAGMARGTTLGAAAREIAGGGAGATPGAGGAAGHPAPVRLTTNNLPSLEALYDEAYPGNWFDPRMLETGEYFGIFDGERIVSAAGIHVFSIRYRVAALGNIVTRPEYRGRGLGTQVTAALCSSLTEAGVRIGLNVKADNHPALASYRKLGFEVVAPYNEYLMERRPG
jgi:GNAT superfamily N-acetyltransferase